MGKKKKKRNENHERHDNNEKYKNHERHDNHEKYKKQENHEKHERFKFIDSDDLVKETIFNSYNIKNEEINKIDAPNVVKKISYKDENEEFKEEIKKIEIPTENDEHEEKEEETTEDEEHEEKVEEATEDEEHEEEVVEETTEDEEHEEKVEEATEDEEHEEKVEETTKDEEHEEKVEETTEDEEHEEEVVEETTENDEHEEEQIKDESRLDELMKTHKFDKIETTLTEKESPIYKKKYFGFEARIASLVACILITLTASVILLLLSFNFGRKDIVRYNEKSTVNYKVCPKDNPELCIDEELKYSSESIDNIEIDLKYIKEFTKDVDFQTSYHVSATTKVYDKDDDNKILYEDEDTIIDKTTVNANNKVLEIHQKVNLDYKKYNDYVFKYMKNASNNTEAYIDLKYYIDEPNETREVASLNIPLSKILFGIKKHEISNNNKIYNINNNLWTEKNTLYILSATVLLLVTLLLIFKLTNMILKVINHKNKFETAVRNILREYDRIIVVARGGYETNVEKRIIKVLDFDELLDARSALNKPIIYSKINNVKCEFIVEDEKILYKYVMKEADF